VIKHYVQKLFLPVVELALIGLDVRIRRLVLDLTLVVLVKGDPTRWQLLYLWISSRKLCVGSRDIN
jgi:hypothetical protein